MLMVVLGYNLFRTKNDIFLVYDATVSDRLKDTFPEVSVVIIWITETIMTTKLKIIIIFSLLSSIFLVILMLKYHKQQLSVLKFRTSKTVYVPK